MENKEENCPIVQDLLPLYTEDMVKPATRRFVEKHLERCAACRAELDSLHGEEREEPTVAPLREIGRSIKRKRATAVLLAVTLALTLAAAGFAYVTAPQYVPYDESEWQLTALCRRADGSLSTLYDQTELGSISRIMLVLDSPVSGARVDAAIDENGKTLYFISAWRTLWDEWRGKFDAAGEAGAVRDALYVREAAAALLRGDAGSAAACSGGTYLFTFDVENCGGIYYSSNNGQEDILLHGGDGDMDEGVISLPRLALGYYVLLSLAVFITFGIAWLVCRRKKAGRVLGYLALVPACYLAGHLLVKGFTTTSYQMQRDFSLVVLAAVLLYCAALLALGLREQRRSGL